MFCKTLLTHSTNRLAGAAEITANFPQVSEEWVGHRTNLMPTVVNGKTYMGVWVNDCIGKGMTANETTYILQWDYIYIYICIYPFSLSICHCDGYAKMPSSYAGVLLSYIRLQFCIARLLLPVTTSSIWKTQVTDILAGSLSLSFTLHEITQCVYGGMGLLYENGNLSLSLSSLTECLRQQIKGAIIFWSKPQTVDLKAQNISTCFRSYQDTCEMLNFSEVFKDIIALRVFRTQHILKLSGNICWLCMGGQCLRWGVTD